MRLVVLLVIAVITAGLASMFTLPRRVNPEVKIPIVIVSAVLPGAGPKDVESLLTIPLEDNLLGMDKLDTFTSSSRENVSAITMQFMSTVDREKVRDDVQSLVDTVTLPEDALTPQVMALDFENEPIWSFAVSTKSDPATLMRFADRLKDKIEEMPTVNNVDMSGFDNQEITIHLNSSKLQEYGINLFLLAQTVKKSASSYPAGVVDTGESTISLTINPEIVTVDDIRNIRISSPGGFVTLGDISEIAEKSSLQQAHSFVASNTQEPFRAVTFYVYKTSSANIDDTAAKVVKLVEDTVKEHDGKFVITSIQNSGELIQKQYTDLLGDFATTIALVFINLFLFLGLRQALLASLTIPLTFLSGLIIMNIFGLTINFISLFAFLLALGTSIDDTIVTVSSMTTYYRTRKFTAQETGLLVWRDFIVPIWSTTITTIWAYVPLLLTTGIIGEFIKPIPIVVTATMVSSTVYAVLITLPLMVFILKPQAPRRVMILLRALLVLVLVGLLVLLLPKNGLLLPILLIFFVLLFVFARVRGALARTAFKEVKDRPALISLFDRAKWMMTHGVINSQKLGVLYRLTITRILETPAGRRTTLIIVVCFALFSYLLLPLGFVKNEFFPAADNDWLYINLEMPSGTTIDVVEKEALELTRDMRKIPEADAVVTDIGRSFTGQGFSSGGGSGLITIILHPMEERKKSSIDIAQELREKYKYYNHGKISVQEVSGGPPAGADIQISLSGEDLNQLDHYADKTIGFLNTLEGVSDTDKSIKPGTSKLVFVPDKAKLTTAGVTVDQIGLMLRTYASGFSLDKIKFGSKEKEVILRLMTDASSPEEIAALTLQTQNGPEPLISLGELRLENNPTVINREDGKRTVTVTAGVKSGFNVGEINQKLEEYAADGLSLSEGYNWKTGGVNEENAKSVQSIFQAMGLSFLLILITMVIQFSSYRQAAIVLLLIPLAISGVFIVFALTATPLSFPALIGVVALFGVVVTNAMFIVDKINRNRKEGMDLQHAIADAAESRLEPIMLTSVTTILGLIPITISDPLWRGLGGAIIAGLSFSGIIMLFFVPVLYYNWFKGEDRETAHHTS